MAPFTKLAGRNTWLIWASLIFLPLGGCAHMTLGPRMESGVVARDIGFPECRVSIPLTLGELATNAQFVGAYDTESQDELAKVKAAYHDGDEVRYVSCVSGHGPRPPGYSFFGLFRDKHVVLRAYQAIDN